MLLLFLCNPFLGNSQQDRWLHLELTGDFLKMETAVYKDTFQLSQRVKGFYNELHQLGYLNPELIQNSTVGDTVFYKLGTGERFEWLDLRPGNVDPGLWTQTGYNLKAFQNKPVDFRDVSILFEKLLNASENNGHPFAAIQLDSIKRENKIISASINLDYGPYITFDTLKVTGNSKTKPSYLSRLLFVNPGEPFSQKKVNQGIRQVKNLPYLQWVGEPELSFQNSEATLYLPINDRRINMFDGIIGLLPNEIEENKLLVTGQFDLALFNVGGKGRDYRVNWQRLSQYSQNLKISAVEPLLFGSMIDLRASFYLLKEDTTFLNRDFRIDFGYRPNPDGYLSFFYRRQAGDLLAVSGMEQIIGLPEFVDFRYNNYGIQYQILKLDDIFFPRRGVFGDIQFGIGNKEILENTGLPIEVYEEIDLKSIQYYIKAEFQKHFYINNNWSIFSSLSGGFLENKNLFGNDLYRLGGLKTIRGFNENFFFANNYIYINLEPRFYFDTSSYFLIFADIGRLENKVQGLQIDHPISTGIGFTLKTGSGKFNFIYALGRSNTQEFALNLSKIHFGYTGMF